LSSLRTAEISFVGGVWIFSGTTIYILYSIVAEKRLCTKRGDTFFRCSQSTPALWKLCSYRLQSSHNSFHVNYFLFYYWWWQTCNIKNKQINTGSGQKYPASYKHSSSWPILSIAIV
jgi:hypothetical protein